MRWLGFDWGEHLHFASDYFEQLYEWALHLIRSGKAYVDDLSAEEMRALSRHADRARPQQPLARPPGRGEPRPVRAHARRRVSRRRARAARQDRHGVAATSICATRCCTASCTRAHPRTGDAWSVYPTYDYAHGQSDAIEGVTHSLCTLEFEDHRPLYDWLIDNLPVPSRPRQIRVRAPQPRLHGALQAAPDPADRRGPCARLGRSAHADAAGAAPARRAAGGDPRLRAPGRRRARRQSGRAGAAGALRARAFEPDRAAPHGGAAPAQGRARELPEGQTETLEAINNPEDPAAGTRQGAVRRASSTSSATISWRTRRRNSSGWRPGARCACATPTSSPAARRSRTPTARWSSCAAPTTRRPAAAMRPTAARSRARCTGCRPPMPCRPRCGSTTICSRRPEPGAGGDFRDDLNPGSLEVLAECRLEPALAEAAPGEPRAVRAPGLLRPRPRLAARTSSVFNRTVALRDSWARLQAKER